MKNPDMILYRAAIGQIMADAGITRSTIQEMVREVIQEKVNKQFQYIASEEIRKYGFKSTIDRELTDAVRAAIRQELRNVSIGVTITDWREKDGERSASL